MLLSFSACPWMLPVSPCPPPNPCPPANPPPHTHTQVLQEAVSWLAAERSSTSDLSVMMVVGLPNSGKSSLINALKLAANTKGWLVGWLFDAWRAGVYCHGRGEGGEAGVDRAGRQGEALA